jgi:phage terminase large subunit
MKLNKKFQPLWRNDTRYFIVTGGRGSGKSYAVGTFIENLLFQQGHKVLFTRYTLTAASKSIIPEFVEKIDVQGHNNVFDVTNNSIKNIASGSEIIFSGIKTSSGNQTANLKSLQGVTTWVLDEAEELDSPEVFDKIDLSVREKQIQNRVILILNPALREHWIYKRFFLDANVDENFNGVKGDVTYIHSTYLDNKTNLHESFIKRAEQMKAHDYQLYVHVMLGSWLDTLTGRLYSNLQEYQDLPQGEAVMYCDTADTGEDYLCAITGVKTNTSLYITDVVYTKEPQEITESLVAQLIINNKVNRAIIESNNGGRGFARSVQRILSDVNWRKTNITTYHQSANKNTRIVTNSSNVSLNCYFCKYLNNEFMLALRTYTREGKNKHDDAPDALTGLVEHFLDNNDFFII